MAISSKKPRLVVTQQDGLRGKLLGWSRMLTLFFGLEVACQACSALASVLVVHNMDKQHYAWYALANNLQGTLGVFTLMGIGTGLISMGGQYLGNRSRMGALAASAMRYRRRLLAGAAPVALPIFGYLLIKNGCPLWNTALLLLLALVVLTVEFNRQVFSTPVRLSGRYNFLQRAALLEGLLRMGAIGLLIVAGALNATTALLTSVLLSAYVVKNVIRKTARTYTDPHAQPDPDIGRQLTRLNLNVLPSTLSGVFQAQIGMAMISLFGKTSAVADLGALTRIGLLSAIPQAMLSKVVEPKLSRAQLGPELWKKTLAALGLAAAMALATFTFIFITSAKILWILGPNYQHLHRELLCFAAVSSGWIFAGLPQLILYARGWVQYVWITPLVEITCQAVVMPFLDLSHPLGVLSLDGIRAVVSFTFYGSLVIRQWFVWRSAQRRGAQSGSVPAVYPPAADTAV
jgi:O-antigen/teichoic acid export membrane protein